MSNSPASAIVNEDVISSSTPLEMTLAGVHPRVFVNAHQRDLIQQRSADEPYCSMLESLRHTVNQLARQTVLAENDKGTPVKTRDFQSSGTDKRKYGDWIYEAAGYYMLTGDIEARDLALTIMRAVARYESWGTSLMFGHYAKGMACGIDWLWNDLETSERAYFLDILHKHTRVVFDEWASYHSGEPFGYTWNIMGVILAGLSAAAMVLYGERPGISPIINLVVEKTRAALHALGDDGVSPEGIMYGNYYFSNLVGSVILIRDLVGIDLFPTCAWLRNAGKALQYHSLPRQHWGQTPRCFQFGDAHTDRVEGYCVPLRACAAAFKDPEVQTIADALACVVPGKTVANIFSILWHDAELPSHPPQLERIKHFEDLDIVIGRSDWNGDESVFGLKCGAAVGKKGVSLYSNPLAGGHMQPSSGVVQLFSHGDWILAHPGYTWKRTAYHNCLLVNGKGQRGSESEWFEDLSYRQGAPSPTVTHVGSTEVMDHVIAHVAPAYPEEAGIEHYNRHLLYIKPNGWIVLDAIAFKKPSLPEIRWHSRFDLSQLNPAVYAGQGENARFRFSILEADNLVLKNETETILHSSRYEISPLNVLRVASASNVMTQVFISVIETAPVAKDIKTSVTCQRDGKQLNLTLKGYPVEQILLDPFLSQGVAATGNQSIWAQG